MNIKLKKGQRVWWNDPAGETSGYYVIETDIEKEVADAMDDDSCSEEDVLADLPILICSGHSEAHVYAHELEPEYAGDDYHDLRIRHGKLTADMHTFILKKLRENGGVIENDYGIDDAEDVELPAATPLYSKERFHSIVITKVRLDEEANIPVIYADGINQNTNVFESDFYVTQDSYSDIVWFIATALEIA